LDSILTPFVQLHSVLIATLVSDGQLYLIPFLLLFAVLFLPGVLILLTTAKVVYVIWMFVYLLALPIWNFVLPLYAFWHFDDFSWGQTRKVQGENAQEAKMGHGGADEKSAGNNGRGKAEGNDDDDALGFDVTLVPLKKYAEYESARRRRMERQAKSKTFI
jgi:chitin synthase